VLPLSCLSKFFKVVRADLKLDSFKNFNNENLKKGNLNSALECEIEGRNTFK
jgi:hypothetical protein